MGKKSKKKQTMMCSDLLQLKSDFSDWRAVKKHRKERIPTNLMTRTFDLLSKYKATKLCSVLGLNYNDFHDKLQRYKSSVKSTSPDFVQVDLQNSHSSFSCDIGYTFTDGSHLEVHLKEASMLVLKSLMSDLLDKNK